MYYYNHRSVLDELQGTELVYTKKLHWLQTYKLMKKYIHMVDYKVLSYLVISNSHSVRYQSKCFLCQILRALFVCLLSGVSTVESRFIGFAKDTVVTPALFPLLPQKRMLIRNRIIRRRLSLLRTYGILPILNNLR